MKNSICCALALAILCGCTSAPIPKDYSGPIATIQDWARSEDSSRAQFFYLSEIDGRKVDNILLATRQANYGKGASNTPVTFSRQVPARASKLKIEGRIGYGAPIQEMFHSSTMYTAEATLDFTPEPNKTYVVRGVLTPNKQEVWLEEADTRKRIE
ncbi:MAG TPA: hypothetical protein VHB46_06080 [Burkholderiales bacterium]|nr:hypothetical protein [Burkholderiales bacterium]